MTRKQAEALARALDGEETTGEARALAHMAQVLERGTSRPGAAAVRPEFRGELRALLVEEARTAAAAPSLLTRLRDATIRWRYSTRLATATGATAFALSGGGVAAAAEQALPGGVLYPVKLALEEARVALVRDTVAKGERYLSYAAERAVEARISLDEGYQTGAGRALREADESTRKGAGHLITAFQQDGDAEAIALLSDFARDQRRRIASLLPLLEGEAARAARDSLVVLERIEARVVALSGCPSCQSSAAPPTGQVFDFSTIPAADEPFDACPCEPATQVSPPPLRPRPTATPQEPGGQTPPGEEPPPPGDEEPPPPDGEDVLPGLPGPLEEPGGTVNDVLKDVIEKTVEKAPAVPDVNSSDGLTDPLDDAVDEASDPVQSIIDGVLAPTEPDSGSLTEPVDDLLDDAGNLLP